LAIEYFLERLAPNRTLCRLDISLNHLDYRGALIAEDVIEHNRRLEELSVSNNALGVTGLRSLFRLLCRETSSIRHLHCESCESCQDVPRGEDAQQVLNMTNPGGRYSLDLARPYHRSLLRLLLKTCERLGLSSQSAFVDVTYSLPPYERPRKDGNGVFLVPTQGTLAFTFSLSWTSEMKSKGVDLWDFKGFLDRHYSTTRLKLSFAKSLPLFDHWNSINGQASEQLAMLDALSMDFMLSFPQMQEMASRQGMASEVLCRTLHCVIGGARARYLCLLTTPTPAHFLRNLDSISSMLNFVPDNPSWHYALDLGNPSCYAVAEQLMLLDRWEAEVERFLNRVDISQWGNRAHMRNMQYQGQLLGFRSAAEWNLPPHDVFEFDYVTGKRPPPTMPPLDEETFSLFLRGMYRTDVDTTVQINVMRQVSDRFYLTALQLRELLGVFGNDLLRADVFVLLYFRVVDIYNEKVFRARFDSVKELQVLQHRLGHATCFPFLQPENASFELDLACNDQRLVAWFLFTFMNREKVENLKHVSFIDAKGNVDPMDKGVPRIWEFFERIPTGGTFKATYISAPEDRHFMTRRMLYEKYGQWKCTVTERDVMWWTGLTEAPPDVTEFLEFLTSRFSNVMDAFYKIDGVHGNGVISSREFYEGLKSMECKKFAGPDEEERIMHVFRYLDPSGEGGVSTTEWNVLDQLWKEMILCLEEFVKFLYRAFDFSVNFLEEAWEYLDSDDSAQITIEEWDAVVKMDFCYFGPTTVIFHFLDTGDEGSVSWEEFKTLSRFSKAPSAPTRRGGIRVVGMF